MGLRGVLQHQRDELVDARLGDLQLESSAATWRRHVTVPHAMWRRSSSPMRFTNCRIPDRNPRIGVNPLLRIVSRHRHHAFDDVVVGHRRADVSPTAACLSSGRRGTAGVPRRRSCGRRACRRGSSEGRRSTRRRRATSGTPGCACVLERELRQVHPVAEPALNPHRRRERPDVLGHRLLTREELRTQPGSRVALEVTECLPRTASAAGCPS